MQLRASLNLVTGLAAMSLVASTAIAQNSAPFTIRFPPDGATVREKVIVKVPMSAIPDGAYVAYTIDGQFRVALAPTDAERAKAGAGGDFEYIWDTKEVVKIQRTNKEEAPADGQHRISATLYVPRGGSAGGAVAAETSQITVTLENKIATDPGALLLRYRYQDGSNRTYERNGTTTIVGGVTQGLAAVGDVDLIGQSSDLLLAVEDVYAGGNAIVRNRLTRLAVRQGGQETVYPESYLPRSIYEEVDTVGVVHYPPSDRETGDTFWQLGIPISATMDLPILPRSEVRIGDTWDTPNVALDIPGTAPDKQPKVTVKSALVGLEWEGMHQTAKIVQTYEGTPKEKSIVFGNITVDNPQIKYTRTVYLAYRSGTLIKVDRDLQVAGTTSEALSPSVGGMSAPGGSAMAPGLSGPPSMGSGGMSGPPVMGGMGAGSSMPFLGPGGLAGGPGGKDEGREGPGGKGLSRMQRGRGALGGLSGPPSMGSGGMIGLPSMGGGRGILGGGSGSMGLGQATTKQKITLRSRTVTTIKPTEATKP